MDNTIEVRLPDAGRWVKEITAVAERAKTGYDWTGDFHHAGQLIDLEPGTMIAVCSSVGSRKHPVDRVSVRVLTLAGQWHTLAEEDGKEWASSLRKIARTYLALPADERAKKATLEYLATRQSVHFARQDRLAIAQETLEGWRRGEVEQGKRYGDFPFPQAKKKEPAGVVTYREWDTTTEEGRAELFAVLIPAAEARIEGISEAVTEIEAEIAAIEAALTPPAPEPAIDRAALLAERDELLARIAEIDALLKEK